jgi:DNA-binding NarL/FixJ family response regulator
VESHVSAAYRKLGVSTRVELALAVRSAAVG